MGEKKHIEIDFKDKNDSNDDLKDTLEIGTDLNSFKEHSLPSNKYKNGCAYNNEENDRRMTLQERDDAKIELIKQAIKNPPIMYDKCNPDYPKDDIPTTEIINETIDKTKHVGELADLTPLQKKWEKSAQEHNTQNVQVTDKVKDIIDFDEVRNMDKRMNNIYADAYKELDEEKETNPNFNFNSDIRDYNIGSSDYSQHKIQPWDIWEDYNLNPWDADIVKRVLRKKGLPGMTNNMSRILDYQKIIHICLKRIDQIKNNSNID